MVIKTEYLTIPKVQVLRGAEAVKALNDYIKILEEQKPEELTEKQITVITKFARGLIASIQSETPSKSVKPRTSFFSGIGFSSEIAGVFSAGYR